MQRSALDDQAAHWKAWLSTHACKSACHTWGIPSKGPSPRAKIWTRDLTEDGDIEHQPGPSDHRELDVAYVNAGSIPSLWRILGCFTSDLGDNQDAIVIVETKCTASSLPGFDNAVKRAGYTHYCLPAHLEAGGPAGGVSIIVKRHISQRLLLRAEYDRVVALSVCIGGTVVIGYYGPPGHAHSLHLTLSETFVIVKDLP